WPGDRADGILRRSEAAWVEEGLTTGESTREGQHMATFTERMTRLEQSIGDAVSAVTADQGASPVLAAVVKEFEKKFGKARDLAGDGSDAAATKLAVAEVEQAGDS